MKIKQLISSIALGVMLVASSNAMANLLVETETFEDYGGWRHDHQAFEKIGSAYIQAHGYGRPVADATTDVKFDKPGKYHVYVSTYNWTSPWADSEGPGAFKVMVDGEALPNTLGNVGNKWEWQYAGEVEVGSEATLALRDLTGFHGRADAIYFSQKKSTPPSDKEALRMFRRTELGYKKIKDCGDYDLVVAGGGVAGCCTALTAARYGLKVALVDNLPGLGGNHYIGGSQDGLINKNLYPNIGNMLRQLSELPIPQTQEEYDNEPHIVDTVSNLGKAVLPKHPKQLAVTRKNVIEEAGVSLFQQVHIFEVETDKSGKVSSMVGKSLITGEEMRFSGTLFADCTGDGVIGYLAGADYRDGRESRDVANESLAPEVADKKKMGTTIWWGSGDTGESTTFPKLKDMPWAMPISDEYHLDVTKGGWFWETGLEIDNALEPELVRDNFFRAVYSNFAYLKENYEKYDTFNIKTMGDIGMKRESRRMMGDVILNQNDIMDHIEYPDASFTTTWPIDLHYATEENTKHVPGWEFITECTNGEEENFVLPPYHVPYRVLYSRNVDNLFIGGRTMSVTHVALGTVRVIATLGLAGEVIGMAAKVCNDHKGAMPRDVYEKYLDELKACMSEGAPLE